MQDIVGGIPPTRDHSTEGLLAVVRLPLIESHPTWRAAREWVCSRPSHSWSRSCSAHAIAPPAPHMAGAYAWLTVRLGVCMARTGLGVANLLPALVVE